jgi:hypothetical protein
MQPVGQLRWRGGPGASEQIPREIVKRVAEHATSLGSYVGSDDLFLLALAEYPEGVVARDVLVAHGLDAERIETEIAPRHAREASRIEQRSWIALPPAFNGMYGRAEAFAATLGSGPIEPEHVLLALLWEPHSSSSQLMRRLGIERQAILDSVRARGVPIPTAPLPGRDAVGIGEAVWFDRDDVMRVVLEVPKMLPPDAHFSWNVDGDRAWAATSADVDLRAIIDQVLATPHGELGG